MPLIVKSQCLPYDETTFAGAQKLWLAHTGRYMSLVNNDKELCESIHYNAPKAAANLGL